MNRKICETCNCIILEIEERICAGCGKKICINCGSHFNKECNICCDECWFLGFGYK